MRRAFGKAWVLVLPRLSGALTPVAEEAEHLRTLVGPARLVAIVETETLMDVPVDAQAQAATKGPAWLASAKSRARPR